MKWIKINYKNLPIGDVLCIDKLDSTETVRYGTIMIDNGNTYVQTIYDGVQYATHYMPLQSLSNIEFE